MSAPEPPPPRSHRAAAPGPDLLRRYLPPLVSILAVVVVILLLVVVNSRPSKPDAPGPGTVSLPSTTSPPLRPTAGTTASSHPTASHPAASPTSSVRHSAAAHKPRGGPRSTGTGAPAAAPVVVRPSVTVLNNSRRQGLAADVAREVAGRGWPIRQTGNFRGRIARTTVYYLPGQEWAARELAREFGQIQRIEPRFAGLPGSGLTLVVTRYWTT